MKVEELRNLIKDEDGERNVVLHIWDGHDSKFRDLQIGATPHAKTDNLFVLIEGFEYIKPTRTKADNSASK